MKHGLKGILFDIGGVMLKGNLETFFLKACPLLGIETVAFDATSMLPDFARGKIQPRACFETVFNRKIPDNQYREIINLFTSNWQPDPEMYRLVESIKKKDIRVGVLSNSDTLNAEIFRTKGFYAPFDALTLSHEVGYIKPEAIIYEIAVQRLGTTKEETVFIDDLLACVHGAHAVGLPALQFVTKEKLVSDLKNEYDLEL